MESSNVVRIAPYKYVHILDCNTNTQRIQVGPDTLIRRDHEQLVAGPLDMVRLQPRSYITILNPAKRDKDGNASRTPFDEVEVNFGDIEIRKYEDFKDPFPLYPYEVIKTKQTKYKTVAQNEALVIEVERPYIDETTKEERFCEDKWLFVGPGTYIPRIEERIYDAIKAKIIKPN